ncbi:Dymeclin [Varanus komodoensis]|nr:Dymeclin [Varanus komodoensis]
MNKWVQDQVNPELFSGRVKRMRLKLLYFGHVMRRQDLLEKTGSRQLTSPPPSSPHNNNPVRQSIYHISTCFLQAQDLNVIEEVIRMMLEIINSCLTNSLHHNPNLVYALLYKRDLFEQFRTHPSFQDIMQNIDLVISFFSSRIEQAGAELSVERVLEIIKQGAVALPKDRLRVSVGKAKGRVGFQLGALPG